ncbi:alpha/beta fold hydrolase [Paracoccus jiaweipingae]|uniref:alpha/beta fold hydrolase n=1 Tax=unclassified Paracoccus (in: a-proteobacteria) TaxID=2688777 RepID=UPI0037A23D5C
MSTDLNIRHWPGDPDRPALALHCMMGTASYWGPIADHLGGRVSLSAFDFPGHGRSPDWQPAPDGPDYHTAATRLTAALIDRPLDLIGHSFGATVALRIAVAAPEAVRSLTLIEPTFFAAAPSPEDEALSDRLHAALDRGDNEGAARMFLEIWGQIPLDHLPPVMRTRAIAQMPLVSLTRDVMGYDSANLLGPGRLEAVDMPVMMIAGADSPPTVGRIIDALAERLPDVGRATVPDAGHMVPITHPAEVAGLIAVNLDRS